MIPRKAGAGRRISIAAALLLWVAPLGAGLALAAHLELAHSPLPQTPSNGHDLAHAHGGSHPHPHPVAAEQPLATQASQDEDHDPGSHDHELASTDHEAFPSRSLEVARSDAGAALAVGLLQPPTPYPGTVLLPEHPPPRRLSPQLLACVLLL